MFGVLRALLFHVRQTSRRVGVRSVWLCRWNPRAHRVPTRRRPMTTRTDEVTRPHRRNHPDGACRILGATSTSVDTKLSNHKSRHNCLHRALVSSAWWWVASPPMQHRPVRGRFHLQPTIWRLFLCTIPPFEPAVRSGYWPARCPCTSEVVG